MQSVGISCVTLLYKLKFHSPHDGQYLAVLKMQVVRMCGGDVWGRVGGAVITVVID